MLKEMNAIFIFSELSSTVLLFVSFGPPYYWFFPLSVASPDLRSEDVSLLVMRHFFLTC